MKRIILIFTVFNLISCGPNTPECNNENIKASAVEMFNKKIKPVLVDGMIEEEINYTDLRNYARDRGIDYNNVVEDEKQKLKEKYNNDIDFILSETKIKNIRTENINNEIQKCSCSAEIDNSKLKSINLFYTAQKVEDNDETYWIEVNYKLSEQNEE